MRLLIPTLALLVGAACAPVYVPGAAYAPMYDREGDAHVAARFGTPGGQLDVGYALSDAFHGRVTGQYQVTRTDSGDGNGYARIAAGGGWYRKPAHERDALRLSFSADVGTGRAVGTYSIGSSGTRYSGGHVNLGVQGELGAETPGFGIAYVIRPSLFHFIHDDESGSTGFADWGFLENWLAVRAGSRMVKFETQLGLWLPLAGDGTIGVPFPIILSFGLTMDIPRREKDEPDKDEGAWTP